MTNSPWRVSSRQKSSCHASICVARPMTRSTAGAAESPKVSKQRSTSPTRQKDSGTRARLAAARRTPARSGGAGARSGASASVMLAGMASGAPTALPVDRLTAPDRVEVHRIAGEIGRDGPRAPHRHDYHELLWIREGSGRQRIDGAEVPVRPRTLTLIGRGQVHVFERAVGLRGAVLRFGDAHVLGGAAPGWLLSGSTARAVVRAVGAGPR